MDMSYSATLPAWCGELSARLSGMAQELWKTVKPWDVSSFRVTPEEMGYPGCGLATAYIQAAIDLAHDHGGGTVLLSKGEYVSGTLVMRSGVRLKIAEFSTLMGSTDLADYPEHHARRLTVQDTSMGMHQSLIYAEDCEDIGICGPGTIDGRGSQASFPGAETAQGTPGRPFVMRIIDCRRVHVARIILRDSPCWMQNYLNCEDVLIEHIVVRNHANYNNDGIDLDGCRNVIVHACSVHSGDDALCLKGASQRPMERVLVQDCHLYSACNAFKIGTDTQGDFRDILVRRCKIGGLEQDPSGLKHPWCDSAISLEMVDGGTVANIHLTDLEISRAWSPFFMRLEDRGRVKPGDPAPGPGTLRRVFIENVQAESAGPRGSYFIGIPEKPIEDVALSAVSIRQRASEKPALPPSAVGELRGVYPDAHMIDDLGNAPAYALWARHVHGLSLSNYQVTTEGEDPRPAFALDDDVY